MVVLVLRFGPTEDRFYETINQILRIVEEFKNETALVTSETANIEFNHRNQSGRVMFRRKFMLWDDSNSSVASFNTSFLVNIFPQNNSHGEGLAFLIAPTIDIPNNSHGPYLGLTNATTNNQATNGIVAVELDTVKQNFDNDSNHIGLNIHSVSSVISKPLTPENIILASKQHQLNCVLRWNLTVEYIPGPKSPWMAISLGVGIPVVVGLVALTAYYLYKKRLVNRSQSNILNRLRTLPGMPKEFRFRELKKATNNFDEKRKLGQGGYGVVYRGVLPEDNVEVAVKWFLRDSLNGEGDFLAELTIINRLRHKHLVRLLGVLGTIGYIAPESILTGKATQHSDIYAFGTLLIEVVSGQRPGTKVNGFQFMVDYVWSLYREGRILDAVDKRIADDYDVEEAQRFLLLGLACSHPIASERPKTHTIVQILSGSTVVPPVPPFKPAFVWPAMMPIDDLSQATSIDTTPLSINQYETNWSP
ncbi:hypothetical protein L1987_05671 [Smallanthus sonchifolius]|uniref:Uncharacterized protein n=1 Tax=Smallanthus sonchifolius TaxID=185202 RepID=A0ACB9JW03_9ASTR|nr:hypothetical protein L1987_05671 [Smallanthus sonchifolius]